MRTRIRSWPIAFAVEGLNIERFVRYAGERGVRLRQLRRRAPRRLTALVAEAELPALQQLALEGGWQLTVGGRRGLGAALEWLRARWLLAAAAAMAAISLLAASRFMWRVEILDAGTYDADVRAALAEMGITAPMLRSQVDIGELRAALEWRYPRIAWFECGWRGTTLVVRAVEGVMPRRDGEPDGACDVVAARDGVVCSVVTKAGTPMVEAGDIVREGQVLIKGEERTADGAVRAVAARGSVIARVWEGASVRMPATETVTVYTGNTETVWTIRSPWFDLWTMEPCAYDQYDTAVTEMALGGFLIPLTLHVETRMEADCTTRMRDPDELEEDAYAAALHKLHEKVGWEESLIDIWGNCSMIDAENVLSVAIGELRVEIGVQVPASGMAAPEQASP